MLSFVNRSYSARKAVEMRQVSWFLNAEDGAVTVDWVVLTAAITMMGLLVINMVWPSTVVLGNRISDEVASVQVGQ
jgi:hypothetical protein